MRVSWHSFDFRTGNRGPEVTVRANPAVTRIIGEPTDATLDVLMWDEETQAPTPGWETATLPGRVMLVALDDDEQPVWGGLVVRRVADAGPWVSCSLVSPEGYLDRRFTGDEVFDEVDQATIARELLSNAAGGGMQYASDAPASGRVRDRTYLDDDDKTVLSALQELMEVKNGPEFTCDLVWADDTRRQIERVWRVRDRIGTRSTASFEMPGSITGYTFVEDYTAEHGANDVLATSSGEGDVRPESDRMTDIADGWVAFEHRFTPSTSITKKSRLNSHAEARLAAMRDGLEELTFEAHLSTAPRVGSDWHLGDDVRVVITSPRFPARVDANGATVAGLEKWVRVVGYTLDFDADRLIPITREAV